MALRTIQFGLGKSKAYEDTSFVTGDSPRTLDIRTDMGRPSNFGYVLNDGPGDFTIAVMNNERGEFGDEHTIKDGDMINLNNANIRQVRITWVSNSSYRFAFF